ncbi:hypothetical protein OG21DRAFT_1527849 [Imleria badia]|nr:hypothetical protein OG21DRAFT_1527849 [Imleria badia]
MTGNPPGGDDNPPPGGGSRQPPKDPPENKKSLKKLKKGAAAPSKTKDKGKQPKSSAPMPGEFQTPPLGSQLERIMKDALSEYGDTMSPLTPQCSKIEPTRITINPKPDPREESPLAQVYTEDVMPSFRRPETPLDPQITLITISNYLEGIQRQWINYRQGPKEFHNHGVNPRFHQAQKIECLKAALTRETDDESTNRAKSSETEIPIKRESEEVGSSTSRDEDRGQRGLAPNMLNHPAYLSRQNSDILCHLYGSNHGPTVLHQMGRDREEAMGRNVPVRIHIYDKENLNRGSGSGGNNPTGRGPPGDDPDDDGDSNDEIEDEDKLNAQLDVHPNVRPHAQPNIPPIHGGNIGGNVANNLRVGLPMGPVEPEIKVMNPPKPRNYRGQDDLEKFDDWVSQLLKYYHMFKVTGPNRDEDRVLYTRLFLEGIASEWYNQGIESPDHRTLYWSFEDLICGLFKCFVHEASVQSTADQYDRTRFDHEKGALAFYNNLRCCAYRMVQPSDDYSFKRKFICGLPHSIIKRIFEACGISAEHSTIEEILDEVQQMETAQKALNLLIKTSHNPGGRSSQSQGKHHQQNKKGREGPAMTRGDKPQYFTKVEVQDNQGGPNPQEEIEQPASNDEEAEGGNTPEENEDETSSEELSKDKGPLEYVEDEYEVDDDNEPIAHLDAMYGDVRSSEDEQVVRCAMMHKGDDLPELEEPGSPHPNQNDWKWLCTYGTLHKAPCDECNHRVQHTEKERLDLLVKTMAVHSAAQRASHINDNLDRSIEALIQNLRDQKEKHIGLRIGNQDVKLQTQLGTIWVNREGLIENELDIEMFMEGMTLQTNDEDLKWTWSPLYGAIHEGDLCMACNNQVAHVSDHVIDGVPSLHVALQHSDQFVKRKYDRGWDDNERAQVEGHGLNIDHVHSTLHKLAMCVVGTTRAIKRASETAGERAHIMNRNGFSEELWKGAIRDLMSVDNINILFATLLKSEIVIFSDNVVISIKYKSPEDHPVIKMAVIHTTGAEDSTNESHAFRYALHTKKVDTSTNESCPRVVPELRNCVTIEANINGCKVFIMIDTSSTGNFVSPAFAKVTEMNIFPLEQQLTLQLLIPFLHEHKAIHDFTDKSICVGEHKIALLREVLPESHL